MLKNRRDRARLEYLQTRSAEFRARAEQATDPRARADDLAAARRFDRLYRTERSFPIGIWLWSIRVILVMLPWSLLTRNHHPVLGLALSGAAVITLAGWALWRRHTGTRTRS